MRGLASAEVAAAWAWVADSGTLEGGGVCADAAKAAEASTPAQTIRWRREIMRVLPFVEMLPR